MRIFGLKSCDTCRKALKALAAAGYDPVVIDVRTDGIPEADLLRIIGAFDAAAINRASTTWRALSESQKAQDPLTLLRAHPTVMKRPVIDHHGTLTIGWKPEVQAKYLGGTA
ncbi:arsenate reductase family protein [Yoonia sp.]|uniref:arsenate reductase family protein n=1 Tax=Yoonia sp. TaxID=2212373 RepID=UPI002FDA4209